MDATHIMTMPYSSDAPSSVGTENVTDFMLAPGETSVYGQQFLVSLVAPYLKGADDVLELEVRVQGAEYSSGYYSRGYR